MGWDIQLYLVVTPTDVRSRTRVEGRSHFSKLAFGIWPLAKKVEWNRPIVAFVVVSVVGVMLMMSCSGWRAPKCAVE